MKKIYIYLHSDLDNTFILSDRELSDEERYCPICEEYWDLVLLTDNISEVVAMIHSLNILDEESVIERFHLLQGGLTYDEIYSRKIAMYEQDW